MTQLVAEKLVEHVPKIGIVVKGISIKDAYEIYDIRKSLDTLATRNFQMSFFTYLNKFRIKKAEYLLLHTDLKIIEIALETGFDDPNYFTTLFKRETALTPSNYRKRPSNTTSL